MDDLDTNYQILQELRKLNRYSRLSIIWVVVILIVFIAFSSIFIWKKPSPSHSHQKTETTWNDIRDMRDRGQFTEALSSAKRILQKAPNDWYAHSFLGYIYMEMGNLNEAEKEFAVAFKLWPIDDNEKNLKAIRKRIESEKKGAS